MSTRSVPFFDYPRIYTDERESLMRIFDDVGQRGAFIMQQDLRDFEQARYVRKCVRVCDRDDLHPVTRSLPI